MGRKFEIDWSSAKEEMRKLDEKKDFTDKRLFIPEFNKTGTSETVIRFLPSRDTTVPYAKVFSHSFQNKGMWFIEPCPTTIKNNEVKCPVCEYNKENWDNLTEKQQKERPRRTNYYGNILIVKDPLHPENNGKVFLFKYGKKIHDKLKEKSDPPKDSIITPCNIWSLYEGLNFQLIIKKIKLPNEEKPQNNYDSSCFVDTASAVLDGDDDKLEKLMAQLYSIKEFYDPKGFKAYKDLKERFDKVIGNREYVQKKAEGAEPPVTKTVEDEAVEDTKSVFDQIADED